MSEGGPDDHALVRGCLANDQEACAELVNRYARMAGTMIWRTTRDEASVDDLVQETFVRVFRGLPYFRGRAKLSTWICTIANRVAVDHLRRAARNREQPLESENDFAVATTIPVAHGPDPEQALARNEVDAAVKEEVDALPDRFRLPLVYGAIEGVDYDTIGKILGIPVGTVKSNAFQARRILRERLMQRLRLPR